MDEFTHTDDFDLEDVRHIICSIATPEYAEFLEKASLHVIAQAGIDYYATHVVAVALPPRDAEGLALVWTGDTHELHLSEMPVWLCVSPNTDIPAADICARERDAALRVATYWPLKGTDDGLVNAADNAMDEEELHRLEEERAEISLPVGVRERTA